jgi:hypothetical protein
MFNNKIPRKIFVSKYNEINDLFGPTCVGFCCYSLSYIGILYWNVLLDIWVYTLKYCFKIITCSEFHISRSFLRFDKLKYLIGRNSIFGENNVCIICSSSIVSWQASLFIGTCIVSNRSAGISVEWHLPQLFHSPVRWIFWLTSATRVLNHAIRNALWQLCAWICHWKQFHSLLLYDLSSRVSRPAKLCRVKAGFQCGRGEEYGQWSQQKTWNTKVFLWCNIRIPLKIYAIYWEWKKWNWRIW